MRLGFAVFGGLRAGVVQNASEFDEFSRIRADPARLRRLLDHMPAKPPSPPETQTLFGPLGHRAAGAPGRRPRATEPLGHQAVGPQAAHTAAGSWESRVMRPPCPKNTKSRKPVTGRSQALAQTHSSQFRTTWPWSPTAPCGASSPRAFQYSRSRWALTLNSSLTARAGGTGPTRTTATSRP